LNKELFFSDNEVKDSKLLSPKKREAVFEKIVDLAVTATGKVSNERIDEINILEATRLAMKKAVLSLPVTPDIILIDGNITIDVEIPQIALPGGDRICFSISAASIVAKVIRDRIMVDMHDIYCRYNFRQNKGYGTKEHFRGLELYGPSPVHRRSFSPIRNSFLSGGEIKNPWV